VLLYFTYNDQPSGVYWSQVTDVVAHLNTLGGPRVRLFALVSGRGFLRTRRAIRQRSPDALVWPMVPRMKNWKRNLGLLAAIVRMHRPSGIICRGVMTTWMALRLRDRGSVAKVCFDARGAYAAEWEEYRIIDDDALIAQFRALENEAVNASDLRLAVSNALVAHWRERYAYRGDAHVVIPCTLGRDHEAHLAGKGEALPARPADGRVLVVYSGSTAGWQSLGSIAGLLADAMDRQPGLRLLFLSREDEGNRMLRDRFPDRVNITWLPAEQVPAVLDGCDAGILVREGTITNRVASPTKFAEYLAAGLKVVISEGLGDFSAMVRENALGAVVGPGEGMPVFTPSSGEERLRLKRFARAHCTKEAHAASYGKIIEALR